MNTPVLKFQPHTCVADGYLQWISGTIQWPTRTSGLNHHGWCGLLHTRKEKNGGTSDELVET